MADPRAFTLKVCPQKEPGLTADRRSFFNSVGKIGDLQILNDLGRGGSAIGKGLRTLSSISNTIRTGSGSLPTSIGSSLDAGANWVLQHTGIAPTVVGALQGFNPSIANQAYGQAKQIFQQVKQGSFTMSSIPGALQDLQNLERLGRNIFTPSVAEQQSIARCEGISPYAIDLINRAPKYKFLFVVQFVFNQGYSSLTNLDFTFVVKTSTRPNVRIETEDVNYYNFRSKYITKTEFEEMSMVFHDDTGYGRGDTKDPAGEIGNYALRFYNAYMKATSPITNNSDVSQLATAVEDGMNFDALDKPELNEGDVTAYRYSASHGPLSSGTPNQSDPLTIISEIKLFHVYNGGHNMNVYKFFNPRINMLKLDDLSMAESDGTDVSLTFNYDSVYIDTGVPLYDQNYSLGTKFPGATYPLRYNAPTPGGVSSSGIAPVGAPPGINDLLSPKLNTKTALPILPPGVASGSPTPAGLLSGLD